MALTHFKKAASSIVVICLASRRAYEPIKDAGIESFNTILHVILTSILLSLKSDVT